MPTMNLLKGVVIVAGACSAIAIGVYFFLVRFPTDRAVAEATSLCGSVPKAGPLSWDQLDGSHFMKIDAVGADHTRPPGDGIYLALTSEGALGKYGCEVEISDGGVSDARIVELPGWH